jgi:hypothetical protein
MGYRCEFLPMNCDVKLPAQCWGQPKEDALKTHKKSLTQQLFPSANDVDA